MATAEGWAPLGPTTTVNSAAPISLSEKGLSFPGCLWQVDEVVDLKHLRIKYSAAWRRLCLGRRPQSGRTLMLATTHLLFETIDYLISKGHKRVANSILNSTSDYRWRCRDKFFSDDMVESVDQFPPGLRVENRKGMFSLQPSPDGRYYQCWIIDRIMEKGCIWVAKLVTEPRTGLAMLDQQASSSDIIRPGKSEVPNSSLLKKKDSRGSERRGRMESTADTSPTSMAILPDRVEETETCETVKTKDVKPVERKSHSRLMRVISIMTNLSELVSIEDKDPSDFSQSLTSSLAMLAVELSDRSKHDPPEEDSFGRRAIFDLDGSISDAPLVLTPVQMVLESIPRSAIRGMSVSWVVEPKSGASTDGHGAVKEAYQVRNMVQGMWEFSVSYTGRYLIV